MTIFLICLFVWFLIGGGVATFIIRHETRQQQHLDGEDIKGWIFACILWPIGIWYVLDTDIIKIKNKIKNPFYKAKKEDEK